MWHPGASRQGGANEAFLVPPPNFNVADSGVWQLQKDHVFEIEEVIIEIGGVGGASLLKKLFGFIYLRAASYFSEWRLERASGSSKVLED